MEVVKQHYTIDLSSNNNFVTVPSMQGDGAEVRYAELELISYGTRFEIDPNDITATIMGTKADGTQVFNRCEITNEGYILVEITQQMSASIGRGNYQIALFSIEKNSQVKSFPFYILVTASPFDMEQLRSQDEYQELTELETEYKKYAIEAEASAQAAAQSAQDAESAAATAASDAVSAVRTEMQGYVDSASSSETNAHTSEVNAAASEANAKDSETNAKSSEDNAALSEASAADSATLSESWAVGGTNSRQGEDSDNAKYYAEQAQASLEAINTGFIHFEVQNGHLLWEPVTP